MKIAIGVLVAAFCASSFAVTCETSAVLTHRWSFNGNLVFSLPPASQMSAHLRMTARGK